MRKPKHNYEGKEFLKLLTDYAEMGYTDKAIAEELGIHHVTFANNKATYRKMAKALEKGRIKSAGNIRRRLLDLALGGITVSKLEKKRSNSKNGEMIVTEHTIELPPNLQALSTWLFAHDEEWRQKTIERKRLNLTTNNKEIINTPKVYLSKDDIDKKQLNEIIKKDVLAKG